MKKQGTIKVYKHFPINSLSYKLSELESKKHTFYNSLTRLCSVPLMTYFYVTMGNMFGKGWLITGIVLQAISLPLEIYTIIKSGKNLKVIKADIAKYLSEIEPDVITDEEDQKEIVKRI